MSDASSQAVKDMKEFFGTTRDIINKNPYENESVDEILDHIENNHYLVSKHPRVDDVYLHMYSNLKTLAEAVKVYKDTHPLGKITTQQATPQAVEPMVVYADSSMSTYRDGDKVIGINKGECRITDRQGKVIAERSFDEPHSNNFYEAHAIMLAAYHFSIHDIYNGVIYSDSQTARAWFNNQKLGKVKYDQTEIQALLVYFKELKDKYNFELKEWNTKTMGEIPADYGKK